MQMPGMCSEIVCPLDLGMIGMATRSKRRGRNANNIRMESVKVYAKGGYGDLAEKARVVHLSPLPGDINAAEGFVGELL